MSDYSTNETGFSRDMGSLYGFLYDPSLWLFLAVAIILLVDKWASGQLVNLSLYGIMIAIGGITIIGVALDRNYLGLAPLIQRFPQIKFKLIITGVNIALVVIPSIILYFVTDANFQDMKHTLIVAVWEQLIFAITIPYMLARAISVMWKGQYFKIRSYVIGVILSSVAFGFMHIYVYNYDYSIVVYLMLVGLFIHSIGYLIPSTSIAIHYLINIFVLTLELIK